MLVMALAVMLRSPAGVSITNRESDTSGFHDLQVSVDAGKRGGGDWTCVGRHRRDRMTLVGSCPTLSPR